MTNPTKTIEWLAIRFRHDAETSPGEEHLERDAIEVEGVRDAFNAMLATLKEVLDEVRGFEQRTGIVQFAGWIRRANTAVAKAEGAETERAEP
ncbi:MAG: hypothetical protein ACOY5F_18735 [Pseudomonadota bacterium]